MKTSQPKSVSRRAPRPVRVPPPITRGSEKFEGSEVIGDFQGELGILLWQSLRNVLLWNVTDPAKRKDLFTPGADERRRVKLLSVEVDDSLRSPLAVIARLLADPAGADRKRVASACQRIAEWAETKGATATALAFTQAAALTANNDARLSYAVGRLARVRAEYARAETWFRRAILLGRQTGDWESYSLAFSGLGNLYMQRGNLPAAQRAHLRAYRASRRKGLRGVQGLALHDLFVIASQREQIREAEELAATTLKAYGPAHPRLPFFAHDVAVFWVERGVFLPALRVFEALMPHFRKPSDRAAILGNTARAAAGIGDREGFETAWQQVWTMNAAEENAERFASVFQTLAAGAMSMGRWDQAVLAAEKAVEIATARDEAQVKASAEALLAAARDRATELLPEEQVVEPWMATHAEELAANLTKSLNTAAAGR